MIRFALFVDGSNLSGSLKALGLEVDDYQKFYWFIFQQAAERWRESMQPGPTTPTQLRRVYWYEVGSMDEWDLANPKCQSTLRDWFEDDKELHDKYMAAAGKKLSGATQDKIATEAWAMCFTDAQVWYEKRRGSLEKKRRFHYAIRTNTDWIDIVDTGHWKVDLLHHRLDEKGLDTSLAVDMVTQANNFDVAVLISGDADGIPSIRHLKTLNKEVAAVELVKGYPPEKRGKGFSSKLKLVADLVVRVYEMELASKEIAKVAGQPSSAE